MSQGCLWLLDVCMYRWVAKGMTDGLLSEQVDVQGTMFQLPSPRLVSSWVPADAMWGILA